MNEERRTEFLSTLFYSFRLAQLNHKYYSARLSKLKRLDSTLSVVVMVATAASFGVLAFEKVVPHPEVIAAGLSVAAFLIAVSIPIFGIGGKVEKLSDRAYAFHYAARQLEGAIRFVKAAHDREGEAWGWFDSAQEAYNQAAALPDLEGEDQKLIKKVEDEINSSYPDNYVWTAL